MEHASADGHGWLGPAAARCMILLALALFVGGFTVRELAPAGGDLPGPSALLRDAREVYGAAAAGVHPGWSLLTAGHEPGRVAWHHLWLQLNGLWDARVLGLAGAPLQALAMVVLIGVLARGKSIWMLAFLTSLAAAAQIAPAVRELRVAEPGGGGGVLVALALLQIVFLHGGERSWPRLMVGAAGGLAAVLFATAGLAAPLGLFIWNAVEAAREPAGWKRRGRTLGATAVVIVAGVALSGLRSGGRAGIAFAEPGPLEAWHRVASWPLPHAAWIVLVWAPALFAVGCWLAAPLGQRGVLDPRPSLAGRGEAGHAPAGLPGLGGCDANPTSGGAPVSLLALWSLLQVGLVSMLSPGAPGRAADLLIAGLLINLGCLAVRPVSSQRGSTWRLILGSLWAIAIGNALLHAPRWGVPLVMRAAPDLPLAAALRVAATSGRAEVLAEHAHAVVIPVGELAAVLAEPAIHRLLPPSLRPALPIGASGGFERGAAPPNPLPDGLPDFGTWRSDGASATGELTSEWLSTNLPLLQVRVAGDLRPPDTQLVLQTRDGREIGPWSGPFSTGGNWRRIIFPAPEGEFRVVARDASADGWIAFSAPIELGWLSWMAAKIPRQAGWLFAAAAFAAMAAAALVLGQLRTRRCGQAAPGGTVSAGGGVLPARLLPWLALVAYAVYFANHIDTVAGPNDSGGYLNSAKALDGGHITAAPRMVFGPAQGETDVTPYVPITFSATRDGRLAPQYPVGWPLVIWTVARFMPLEAAIWTAVLLHLVLGVVVTWWVARLVGLPEGWSWLAAAIIGLSPVYIFEALQPLTDGPALVWVTASIGLAWVGRDRPWLAVAAGVATAVAVMIRPSNVLCVLPLLVCFQGRWKQLLLWGLAGLPFALWLAWYNHTLYGAWFKTGYGDVSLGMGARFVLPTLHSYTRWLPLLFSPLVVLALVGPWVRTVPRLTRAMLVLWASSFVIFYAFYWCTWDTWFNMRFVLPAAPGFVILAMIGARRAGELLHLRILEGIRARDRVATVGLALLVVVILVHGSLERRVVFWAHANREHFVGVQWARENLPPNAVVVGKHATGSLMFYSGLCFVRSDHPLVRGSPAWLARIERAGRPVYALTYHWEARGFTWEGVGDGVPDVPGNWERLVQLWENRLHGWKWHPPGPADPGPENGAAGPS